MKQRILTDEEKMKLALDAMTLRSGKLPEGTVIGYDDETLRDMLSPKRTADKGDDLWKVFNVIQEKVTQGGFSAALRELKFVRFVKLNLSRKT